MNNQIEILAPAGDFSSLSAAIQAKADSIYFGIENLNMRSHSSNNFLISDITEVVSICKKNKMKAYLTLNTIIYDNDIDKVKEILDIAKKEGIDGIIASDFSVISYAEKLNLPVHISTQANVSNIEAVRFFSKFADIIVLARELSLEKIKNICDIIKNEKICGPSGKLVKIEIFIHGALCIAISGKCYMSLAQYNMSANRGQCLQACRRKYRVIEEETGKELIIDNKYVMSPKDLCTLPFLEQILASGCSILKIEGRARSAEYVEKTVSTYKEALKEIENKSFNEKRIKFHLSELRSVFNRDFWLGGYYLGNHLDCWSKSYGSKATKKKTYIGKATNYFSKIKVAEFLIQAKELKLNDEILIIGNKTGVVKGKIENLMADKKLNIAPIGTKVAFPMPTKIRKNDMLYLIEENK